MKPELKAKELTAQLGKTVYPMVFRDEENSVDIVGYLLEPDRMTKIRVMDKAITAPVTAAWELFEAILIRNESDPIFMSDKPEHDKFILGATMAAYNLVTLAVDQFKKK